MAWFDIVRLANRLKALSVTQHSSDEESDSISSRRPQPLSGTKGGSGAAFAEVVRASIKAKSDEENVGNIA
jgi:hypothetical protein